MARHILPFAVLLSGACFSPLEKTGESSSRVRMTFTGQEALADARAATAPVGGTVELRITGQAGEKAVVLSQTTYPRDSVPPRLDLRVDLTPCLDFTVASPSCPLTLSVYLRNTTGLAYDSSSVGPVLARPGASVEVPSVSFRPTARLTVIDTAVRVVVGQKTTARVNALDASGALLQGRAFTWRSLDPNVVTVDLDGSIIGVGPGQTSVEVTREGKQALVRAVVPIVESITPSATTLRLILTQSTRLTTTIAVAPGRSRRVVYASSNPAVATVDSTGAITSVGEGVAQISITPDADISERITVSVTVDPFRTAIAWQNLVTGNQGPLPGTVQSIYGTRPDSLIAATIGSACFLSRFNGVSWRLETSGPICARAFTGTSMSDMWAVGNGIQRWNGTAWVRDPVTFSGVLLAATTVDGTNFAVGTGGLIMRRTGGAWSQMPSPTTQTLRSVSALSPTLAYAVGDSGTVLRMDGTTWTRLPSPSRVNLVSVLARNATEVYATGSIQAPYLQETLRFDGSAWTVMPVDDGNGMSTLFTVGSDLYVAGYNGIVMRLENGRFVRRASNAGLTSLTTAWSNGTYTMLAGGDGFAASFQPDAPTPLNFVPSYLGIWAASPNAIWAVGIRGGIDFFNGSTWTNIRGDNVQSLSSIFGFDANTVWVGGTRGTMLRLQGGTFTPVTVPVSNWITSIWGTHPDSLWAVTDGAQFLRWNGAAWTIAQTAPSGLRSVNGSSGRAAMAVGDNGVIMRWNGATWTRETSGITSSLSAVFAPDTSFAVAVGDSAVLQRVNGVWQNVTTQFGSVSPFFRVATGSSRRDAVIAGCAGVWRYDGVTWVRETLSLSVCISSGFAFPGGGMITGGVWRNINIGTGPRGNRPGLPPS